jgi:UDP-glucuronate 4-epimerase
MNILVTGSAGFIGFHLCKKLLSLKEIRIFGLDNINNYYSKILKKKRLEILNNRYGSERIGFEIQDLHSEDKKHPLGTKVLLHSPYSL